MSQTYQSRIFSFISRHTNQLKDSCTKGWRHLKVSVVWSGQILLHPLQILAQATKILKPQLPPSSQTPQLPQPAPDIDLEDALYLIQTAGYSIKIAIPPSSLPAQAFVEPTESSLTDRPTQFSFSDATGTNFISRALNSLSNGAEILKFNNSSDDRSLVNHHRADLAQFDSTPDDCQINYTPVKPTIRGLSSQLSDRQIVLVTTENQLIDTLTIAQQQQIRRCIGIDLATTWERWQTSTFKPQQTTPILQDRSQLLLTSETSEPATSLLDRLNNWFYNFSRQQSPEISPIQPKPASSKIIVPQLSPSPDAEIFIGSIGSPIANRSFFPEYRSLDLPQLPPIIETDLDLPPNPPNILTKLQPNWLKQWVNYYQDYIYIPNDSREIVGSVEEFKLIPIEPKYDIMKLDSKIRQSRFSDVSTKISPKSNPYLEYYPDWIDTTAEDVGYARSPLGKILMWLDRVAVKIENWAIEIWQLLQQSFSSKI
jgi:hypothetical protein